MENRKVLITGGAGYIGSHTCIELLINNKDIIVVDNLSNSNKESINRVEKITGKKIKFYECDLKDKTELNKIFLENKIDSIIHFAGLKAVGESNDIPIEYFNNNIIGTLNILSLMEEYKIKNLVFSSSAAVYGKPETLPISENASLSVTNPYARTKLIIEEILKDFYKSDNSLNFIILRYFNPVGAHKSGKIGENPRGIPQNLIPFVSQVAMGKLDEVKVFGNDYDTKDGTGVRDYIHVVDLAKAHIAALRKLSENPGLIVYNIGTGEGFSVLDIIRAFEKITEKEIKYKIVERRNGDIDSCYADPTKANIELGWKANYKLYDMVRDTWRWQTNNPDGF